MAGLVAFTKDPPFHVKVLPALIAVRVDEPDPQLIAPLLLADAITGTVVLLVIDTTVVVTHPFAAFVDVNV